MTRLIVIALPCVLGMGCDRTLGGSSGGGAPGPPGLSAVASASAGSAGEVRASARRDPLDRALSAGEAAASLACAARRAELARAAAFPGTSGLDANRPALLGRAKAEPVVFLRTPRQAPATTPEVAHYRALLAGAQAPARVLLDLYSSLRRRPLVAREVLLREGYVYSESPEFGVALVDVLELRHLFSEKEIVLERGAQRHHLRWDGADYRYLDGPESGTKASVFLFDRVWVAGQDPGPPLHRALDALVEEAGTERITIERWTEHGALARVRYGTDWVEAVLDHDGARLLPGCEEVRPEQAERVATARSLALRRRSVLRVQREVIAAAIAEQLPFDEPKTEEGQQDGNLRPYWRWAYDHGWDQYRFNEDKYAVFDSLGRPRVPQVCIDFVFDTFERASGTWWKGRGTERARVVGRLDFTALGVDNRRSVKRFVDFAWAHPEWFDAYDLLPEERIPLHRREEFFAYLAEHADGFIPGDVVTIHGPRGDEAHYHSFFVVAADPVSGMPILLAANAGRPRLRTWEQEMRNAPKRRIRSRVRPRLEWLEANTAPVGELTLAPPPRTDTAATSG
ncbi:MAG: hypothetical protein JW751_15145 [Polyangiaceae bacterium]|nr:hypothetical protein [Polyangiaceae bacterium]